MSRVVLIIEFEVAGNDTISDTFAPVLKAANKIGSTKGAWVTYDARDLADVDRIKRRIHGDAR